MYLKLYESYRFCYVGHFLIHNKYDDFNRLFVKEYQNSTFTGTDILYWIQQEILTEKQLSILESSLEDLKEAYRVNKPGILQ